MNISSMVRRLVLVRIALYLTSLAREHVREPAVLVKLHCVLPHAVLPNLDTLSPQRICLVRRRIWSSSRWLAGRHQGNKALLR
jgi:hypothetical protein